MSGAHFVVFAARGRVGARVCSDLHAQGHRVTAVTTDAGAEAALTDQGYTPCIADIRQPDALREVCTDADAVFLATADAPDQSAVEIGLIEMMRAVGVPYVVKLSAQSAGLNPPLSFGKDHFRAEQALAVSGIAHAILRPTFFLQSLLMFASDVASSGKLIAPTGKGKAALVDVRDVADCAVTCLTGEREGAKVYTLTGPEAHSFGDVAVALSDIAARKVSHVSPPAFMARIVLPMKTGMPRWQSNLAIELMSAIRKGAQSPVSADVEAILGRTPLALGPFLAQHEQAFRL